MMLLFIRAIDCGYTFFPFVKKFINVIKRYLSITFSLFSAIIFYFIFYYGDYIYMKFNKRKSSLLFFIGYYYFHVMIIIENNV